MSRILQYPIFHHDGLITPSVPSEVLLQCVREVRHDLNEEFDVYNSSSCHYQYAGLCDRSVELLESKLEDYPGYEVIAIHGELRHSIYIDPQYWDLQHTACIVEHPLYLPMYVDPTVDQFQDILKLENTLPSKYWGYQDHGYISIHPFPYIYTDEDNIAFSDIGFWIDDNIKVKKRIKGWDTPIKIGLVQFIQFEIWGGLAKVIRKICRIGKR